MRLLFVQRHFWPDVPTYAHLTKVIAAHLAAEGHKVTVLSAIPSYNAAYTGSTPPLTESIEGVTVRRIRMHSTDVKGLRQQAWDASLFLSHVTGHLIRHRRDYDTIVVTNAPPIFLAALIRLTARLTGTPYVYHCQDLQPEAGFISGDIPRGIVGQMLMGMDRRSCEDATAVVVLSSDMRSSLVKRGLSDRNAHTINNFIIESATVDTPMPIDLPNPHGAFRVVFAGNMGRFQGLERVIEAARILAERQDIQFVFMGSGSESQPLQAQAGALDGKNVEFVPHQLVPGAMAVLAESHLGLVPLRPEMYRVAYPSKIMAYVEAGCRLLLLMECESEAAQTVEQHDIGRCCEAADPQSIADAILGEYHRYKEHGGDRERIRRTGRDLFAKENVLPRWSALFASIDPRKSSVDAQTPPPSRGSDALVIRPAASVDIDDIVAIHAAAFPSFTMTRLGPRFLRRYYETVLGYHGHVFLVAEDQRRTIVGFVAGFVNPSRFYAELRRHRWVLGRAALPALVRHPTVALDARGGSDWARDQTVHEQGAICELASIGILPTAVGGGVGSALVKRFAAEAFAAGSTEVALTTDADDNDAVRTFYERLGFQNTGELRRGSARQMVGYRLYPDNRDA